MNLTVELLFDFWPFHPSNPDGFVSPSESLLIATSDESKWESKTRPRKELISDQTTDALVRRHACEEGSVVCYNATFGPANAQLKRQNANEANLLLLAAKSRFSFENALTKGSFILEVYPCII